MTAPAGPPSLVYSLRAGSLSLLHPPYRKKHRPHLLHARTRHARFESKLRIIALETSENEKETLSFLKLYLLAVGRLTEQPISLQREQVSPSAWNKLEN